MTFTEVMFAVIILGIGFIMLAAVFPVAIQQTKTSVEQTQGAAMSRSALRYMEEVGTLTDNATLPLSLLQPTANAVIAINADNTVNANNDKLRKAAAGNMIRSDDPRFAFVPLYRRVAGEPFAQIYVFAVQSRNRDTYDPSKDLVPIVAGQPANLEARPVNVAITKGTSPNPDTIQFSAYGTDYTSAVGEGAYVVFADTGSYAGDIFRVGVPTGAANTYELAPGYDAPATISGKAYIVGKQLKDPDSAASATNGYSGLIQDVGCYTTFVRVN